MSKAWKFLEFFCYSKAMQNHIWSRKCRTDFRNYALIYNKSEHDSHFFDFFVQAYNTYTYMYIWGFLKSNFTIFAWKQFLFCTANFPNFLWKLIRFFSISRFLRENNFFYTVTDFAKLPWSWFLYIEIYNLVSRKNEIGIPKCALHSQFFRIFRESKVILSWFQS